MMDTISMTLTNFFAVASRHAEWVAERRTVAATNIANANTPRYKAQAVGSFADELSRIESGSGGWFSTAGAGGAGAGADRNGEERGSPAYHSGNNVSLDNELMTAGAVARDQMLNAGLTKAFNRLITLSARS